MLSFAGFAHLLRDGARPVATSSPCYARAGGFHGRAG